MLPLFFSKKKRFTKISNYKLSIDTSVNILFVYHLLIFNGNNHITRIFLFEETIAFCSETKEFNIPVPDAKILLENDA